MRKIRAFVSVSLCLLLLISAGALPLGGAALGSDTARFSVAGELYEDFGEAMTASAETGSPAVLLSDLTLGAGEYTVPDGAVLQIPCDSEMTGYISEPGVIYEDPGSVTTYRRLTLGGGAKLSVEGELAVSGRVTAAENGRSGRTAGACGCLALSSDSELDILSTGRLYAWGLVTGTGEVTARPGSYVAEAAQLDGYYSYRDLLNGLKESNCATAISGFSACNIEAPMTLFTGAQEKAFVCIVNRSGGYSDTLVDIVGEESFFTLSDGASVTKSVDSKTGRTVIETRGDVLIDRISIDMSGPQLIISKTIFPLSAVDLFVREGELRSSLGLLILPDSALTVDRGASFTADGPLYAVDAMHWSGGGYSSGSSARININGVLTAEAEFGVASVSVTSSENSGSVCFNSDSAGALRHAVRSGGSMSFTDVSVASPALKSTSGAQTDTSGHAAHTGYKVVSGKWSAVNTIRLILQDGADEAYTYAANGEIPSPKIPAGYRDGFFDYTFRKWSPELSAAAGPTEYTAVYYRDLRTDEGVISRRRGDADADGEVTILDATHIQRYLVGLDSDKHRIIDVLGDVDADGEASVLDATQIQRYLAGFKNTYRIDRNMRWSERRDPVQPAQPTEPTQAPSDPPTEAPTTAPTQPPSQYPTTKYELPVI